jgi:hypothetical protein
VSLRYHGRWQVRLISPISLFGSIPQLPRVHFTSSITWKTVNYKPLSPPSTVRKDTVRNGSIECGYTEKVISWRNQAISV